MKLDLLLVFGDSFGNLNFAGFLHRRSQTIKFQVQKIKIIFLQEIRTVQLRSKYQYYIVDYGVDKPCNIVKSIN